MAGMTLGWAAGAAFNNYVRRPIPGAKKWWGGAFSIVSSLAGMVYGQIKRAEAHRDFVASLENRPGFFQALENVHVRTGGQRPLGLPTAHSASFRAHADTDHAAAHDQMGRHPQGT
ncbi:hypothetical protein EWM64_g4967 [Hericium alpestre]|uniref:Uncharacterized protein n=1 Tax=Hericium alpestre TaxID=135208 RepID=A0A4Y9ZXX6_9AGAM|nr:hypothetical protein EWM64_g4967 [Hericium alpestre]